ncbi:MAG TPA: ATP-binding protein [Pyrinomonadaceae bacterium]|nr:ATP-binding protein [Pyrinomonadaceae bacterium]
MSKRNTLLIAVSAIAVAVVLLLPSFTTRAVSAAVLLLAVALLIVKTLSTKPSEDELEASLAAENDSDESAEEIFARGKLFEATMNGMREGLLVVDTDMRVVASNTAAHQLFSPSREKLESQRLTELTRNPAIYSAFLDALKGIERSDVKVEIQGSERLVFDLRVVPLAGSNGKESPAQGALGVFIDVTRTEHLEQVRQEFLSNVSHELRTPLTAILAFIETLEAGAIDDKEASHRFLSIIRRNAARMHELIDDILELSAIEAGNVQVKVELVELHPIVNDVISSLANKAAAQSIVLNNAVPPDTMVYADARRLEQMLTNLVENAIKFNRANGSVTIRSESDRGDNLRSANVGRRSRIMVEDTGEGIPAQHVERLFERFYRVDRARSRELGGIGLGLAIVKHLARAHGGEVTVTSELGRGSVFTIELPLG